MFARIISAPAARRSSGVSPVTDARVPTGMNAGVSTVPREVVSVPRRARVPGSRAPVRKAKVIVGGSLVGRAGSPGRGLRSSTRRGGSPREWCERLRAVIGPSMALIIRLFSDFV